MSARGDSFTRTYDALCAGGYTLDAERLRVVSESRVAWEQYARDTFLAHADACPPGKLRFLQYVTNDTRPWWEAQRENGAVIL
jgi:hypothetical protein